MNKKSSEKGQALILIAIAVAALVVGGWFATHHAITSPAGEQYRDQVQSVELGGLSIEAQRDQAVMAAVSQISTPSGGNKVGNWVPVYIYLSVLQNCPQGQKSVDLRSHLFLSLDKNWKSGQDLIEKRLFKTICIPEGSNLDGKAIVDWIQQEIVDWAESNGIGVGTVIYRIWIEPRLRELPGLVDDLSNIIP